MRVWKLPLELVSCSLWGSQTLSHQTSLLFAQKNRGLKYYKLIRLYLWYMYCSPTLFKSAGIDIDPNDPWSPRNSGSFCSLITWKYYQIHTYIHTYIYPWSDKFIQHRVNKYSYRSCRNLLQGLQLPIRKQLLTSLLVAWQHSQWHQNLKTKTIEKIRQQNNYYRFSQKFEVVFVSTEIRVSLC